MNLEIRTDRIAVLSILHIHYSAKKIDVIYCKSKMLGARYMWRSTCEIERIIKWRYCICMFFLLNSQWRLEQWHQWSYSLNCTWPLTLEIMCCCTAWWGYKELSKHASAASTCTKRCLQHSGIILSLSMQSSPANQYPCYGQIRNQLLRFLWPSCNHIIRLMKSTVGCLRITCY